MNSYIKESFLLILLASSVPIALANYLPPILSYILFDDSGDTSVFDSTVVPIPDIGAYHGVYTTEDIPGGASQYTVEGRLYGIAEFEKMVYQTGDINSKRVAFDRQFYRWDNFLKDDDVHPYIYATSALGRIPSVSITSKLADGSLIDCPDGSSKLVWACIADGELDEHINTIADRIKNSGLSQLIFTFVHEPEDEIRCNANDDCMGTASDYVAAWRHIVMLFRQQNVSNVDFMWIVRHGIFGQTVQTGFPTADEIYPGDDYIDWIAADPYNYSFKSGGVYQWRSLREVAEEFYAWGKQRPKPLAFGEWGTREEYFNLNNDGSRKATWFDEAKQWLKTDATRIKAVMYFNRYTEGEFINPDDFGNTGPNWKVDTTPASLAAYQALAQDPYFIGIENDP
ncbi:MAG: hypothetical protein KTR16_09815 [Acidiferrobacterales bacterium]|nr:hypothetical protein [Acidiferrobacterales bacterium]